MANFSPIGYANSSLPSKRIEVSTDKLKLLHSWTGFSQQLQKWPLALHLMWAILLEIDHCILYSGVNIWILFPSGKTNILPARQVSKILFSPWENKFHIFKPPYSFFIMIYTKHACHFQLYESGKWHNRCPHNSENMNTIFSRISTLPWLSAPFVCDIWNKHAPPPPLSNLSPRV